MSIDENKYDHKVSRVGAILGNKYEIIKILGLGDIGITYLAELVKLYSKFVIKEHFPEG